ncbi:glycerophosphodiester phosphodiesterase family protein [Chitinophaga barathri]|uniref:Glycerophosphodiester phosphodiesterase n=1 Tax=Chitinophaga barathri TaxID=1647451 RepID=A0A3N4MD95_9BACT|nr:glycerophosphodiester phosphodiesterase family protein [Chitinophaga barathri]RPD41691.1 glycerophosphodiester phosphodiesterase [Chitinophaga barathri]
MLKSKYIIPVLFLLMQAMIFGFRQPAQLHTIHTGNAGEIKDFFKYTPDRLPFVSAHRGGPRKGFPENCIATFENTLSHCPATLEIDPRFTKDGKIVLMHDPNLERTTNGTGRVVDHTLAELKKLRLKDTEGNLTNFTIPTLDEALEWAKGKTILVIDAKDVPIDVRAGKVVEHKAEGSAIIIAYSIEDIQKCYKVSKDIVMEVMAAKPEQIAELDKCGVPWENMIGFVSHDMPQDKNMFSEIHKRGAMCILGSSRNIDRQFMNGKITAAELEAGYLNLVRQGADVIEADLGIESGAALSSLQQAASSKAKYFRK